IAVLRGPLPPPGLAGLRRALQASEASLAGSHPAPAKQRLSPADWQAAAALIDAVEVAIAPLAASLRRPGEPPASSFLAAHCASVEAAAAGADQLFSGSAGKALAALFDELAGVQPE